MKFSSFWIFRNEVLVKLYFPFAKKIPLNPPFSNGEFTQRGQFPLFEKACPERSRREGSGGDFGQVCMFALNSFPAAREHQSNFSLFLFIESRPAFSELFLKSTQGSSGIYYLQLLFEGIKEL
jgi:hypothetical protein